MVWIVEIRVNFIWMGFYMNRFMVVCGVRLG